MICEDCGAPVPLEESMRGLCAMCAEAASRSRQPMYHCLRPGCGSGNIDLSGTGNCADCGGAGWVSYPRAGLDDFAQDRAVAPHCPPRTVSCVLRGGLYEVTTSDGMHDAGFVSLNMAREYVAALGKLGYVEEEHDAGVRFGG